MTVAQTSSLPLAGGVDSPQASGGGFALASLTPGPSRERAGRSLLDLKADFPGMAGDWAYLDTAATAQKPQRRVHSSPRIMMVAVPRSQQWPRFGQRASSHTVTSFFSRSSDLVPE